LDDVESVVYCENDRFLDETQTNSDMDC
jgi:hypothetical protein